MRAIENLTDSDVLKALDMVFKTLAVQENLIPTTKTFVEKSCQECFATAIKDLQIVLPSEKGGLKHRWNRDFVPSYDLSATVLEQMLKVYEERNKRHRENAAARLKAKKELKKSEKSVILSADSAKKLQKTEKKSQNMEIKTESVKTESVKTESVKTEEVKPEVIKHPNLDSLQPEKEMVNHPAHYTHFSVECLEMMKRIWGVEAVKQWCEMTEFKYLYRLGEKDDESQEIAKVKFYREFRKGL